MTAQDGSDWKRERGWIRQDDLMYGGLLAIGLVLLQAFMEEPSRDVASSVGTIAFAVAMPLLGVLIMANQLRTEHRQSSSSRYLALAKGMALASSFTGVVAAFWHVTWVAGVVVLASGVLAEMVHSSVVTPLWLREHPLGQRDHPNP